jgi:hypothetical protein
MGNMVMGFGLDGVMAYGLYGYGLMGLPAMGLRFRVFGFKISFRVCVWFVNAYILGLVFGVYDLRIYNLVF